MKKQNDDDELEVILFVHNLIDYFNKERNDRNEKD